MSYDFLRLYDQCFDDVYRYVYFKVGNKWDADDLVSEVFRKAFEKVNTVQNNPKAWLMTIARNTVTDFYRKRRDIPTEDEDLDKHSYDYRFEDVFIKREEMHCLKKSLQSLPKEDLEIVNLKYFAGLSLREIAEILGKTTESIKMRSFRINKKLGELVKKCLEG